MIAWISLPGVSVQAAICLLVGLLIVFIMARMMGIFCLLCLGLACLSASSQTLSVVNLTGSPWTVPGSTIVFPVGETHISLTSDNVAVLGSSFTGIDTLHDWMTYADGGGVYTWSYDIGTIAASHQWDYGTSVAEGMGLGFMFLGFGWTYRFYVRPGDVVIS